MRLTPLTLSRPSVAVLLGSGGSTVMAGIPTSGGLFNEVHGGKSYEDLTAAQLRFEETASTYCEWVRSVEDPQSGLADFQLWLEGDPETAWNEFYVDQYD